MADEPRPEEEGGVPVTEPTVAEGAAAVAEAPRPRLKQQVETRDIGPCKKHVKVTVERDDIDERINEKFSELMVDANVAGFRPGKAPRKVIERRFRKEVLDQVRGEVLLASLEQLGEENDIAALSPPNIDPSKIEIPKEGPLVYEFDVEVRPQFELPNYKGLKLKRPVQTFTEQDVDREMKALLAPYGQLVPKPEPAVVELDDTITADLTLKVDDKVVRELKEQRIHVEAQLAFKDAVAAQFGEQIKGARVGEQRTVDVTLSDRVADSKLRGRKIQAIFDIKDVKTTRLPEVSHELCHEFGVHSEGQLRELIKVVLERRLEYLQRQEARKQVLAHVLAASDWELPHDLLARQARSALGRRVMEMRSAGISDQEIEKRLRLLQQDTLQSTALALKEHFVLQKIAELENLEVTEDDINEEIERLAAQTDESPRRLRARLEKEELLDSLAAELIERKALDLVLQHAEYEDVPIRAEEVEQPALATVEEQAVPGEMKEPAAEAPAAEAEGESDVGASAPAS